MAAASLLPCLFWLATFALLGFVHGYYDETEGNSVVPLESCSEVYDMPLAQCPLLKRKGYCLNSKKRMKVWCPKACGFCRSNAPAPVKCKLTKFGCCKDGLAPAKGPGREGCPEMCLDQKNFDCARYNKKGYCVSHFNAMRRRCPKTCNYCGREEERSTCFNVLEDNKCEMFFSFAMCDSKEKDVYKTMHTYCRKTCGECTPFVPLLDDVAPKCASKGGCCWDNITPVTKGCPKCVNGLSSIFCTRFEPECSPVGRISSVQTRMLCPDTCGLCNVNHTCRDDLVYGMFCRHWKKDDLCKKEPMKMGVFCKKTCGFCK